MLHAIPMFWWRLALAAILHNMAQAQGQCPWEDPSLEKWSNPSTWPSGTVPGLNATVVIPSDKRILLDVPIPRIWTLTIEGVLVWDHVGGIRMETSYILIDGEFHIGSEECKFNETADIFLYGLSNTTAVHHHFGRKFIGANSGSILEFHGQPKKSWTQLTATVGPNNGSCAIVYDSEEEKFGEEFQEGLHVVIWNPDGTVFDYGVFATESGNFDDVEAFAYKIGNATLRGKVVAIAVREDIGQPLASWTPLYEAIESLGGQDIRDIKTREPYTLVAVAGHPNTAQEMRVTRESDDEQLTASSSVTLEARNLVFSALSQTIDGGENSTGSHRIEFRVVARRLAYPLVSVLDDVTSWQPGDEVVVASTDFDWRQREVKKIVQCYDCAKNQFRVEGEFQHSHYGHVTYGVDQRAEVGLLSRNIRIEAELQDECYANNEEEVQLCARFGFDTYGGHTMFHHGSFARVEGIQMYHLGQHYIGRYPIHWHLSRAVPGQYVNNSVIRDSTSRCITIHGADNATVADNVCFNHMGHGIFMEDSGERWNIIHRNLVIGTTWGTLLMSDRRKEDCEYPLLCNLLGSYWIARPENFVTDNVAAGSDGHGIVNIFADVPLGKTYDWWEERGDLRNMSAQSARFELFSGNTMHSNFDYGLWFDGRISIGQWHKDEWIPLNGVIRANTIYDPRIPPEPNGTRTETILSGLTFYKNLKFDSWMRCGNIVITNSSYADTTQSASTAHSFGETSCDIRHSIFIGQTDNKGEPFTHYNNSEEWKHLPKEERPQHHFDRSYKDNKPEFMQSGVTWYQGPMFLHNCYFDRYFNDFYNDSFINEYGYRPVRPSAAIGFHRTNTYPTRPTGGVSSLKFGFCDGVNNAWRVMNGNETSPGWVMQDGTDVTIIKDYDGSLTGRALSSIVRTRPFFTGPECLDKPEWDSSICPYKYGQLVVRGKGGVLSGINNELWPVLLNRDDATEDVINLQGSNGNKYPIRFGKSYTVRFNTSLGDAPRETEIKVKYGLELGDSIRLAICFPKSTTSFNVQVVWPEIDSKKTFPVWVNSPAEVNADTTFTAFHWDSTTGYLYFKVSTNETMTSVDQEAAGDVISEVHIKREDGDDNPATCTTDPPAWSDPSIATPAPVTEAPCSGPDSPKGLGAPIEEDYWSPAPREETCADCPAKDPVHLAREAKYRGCFRQDALLMDFQSDLTELKKTMTPQLCMSRCFQRDFPFAGLYSSDKCECTYAVGRNGARDDTTKCQEECTGDTTQKCGGNFQEITVYTTGAALPPAPARCGPLSRGVYYDGKCLYLNYVKEDFWSAQARCVAQGGVLAKIDTAEKMRFVETYLSDVDSDVWFGVYGTSTTWYFMDDTPSTYGNWREGYVFSPQADRFLYMIQYRRYKWKSSTYNKKKVGLCDLSLEAAPAPSGNCGYQNKGTIFVTSQNVTTDLCFARVENIVAFEDADFACKRMFGRMATINDPDEQANIEEYLNGIDDGVRYWVDGTSTTEGREIAYKETIPRNSLENSVSNRYRTLCVLDTEDTDGCAAGWIKVGDSCYLDTSIAKDSYFQAAALCDSERTSILSIDSQEESTNVKNLFFGTLWLDVRYNGVMDNLVKSNGEASLQSLWPNPDFLQTLSEGLCLVSDVDSETWQHVHCSDAPYTRVVCEAPLTYF